MKYPVKGSISSGFGNRIHPVTNMEQFHNGVDIPAPEMTPIHSPASGKVTKRYYNETGGNQLVIQHDNGYTTGYAHLNAYSVKDGDAVTKNMTIGYVGKTGRVTGSHLHFTLKKGDTYLNPENFFRWN